MSLKIFQKYSNFHQVFQKILHFYFRASRSLTIGVRAIVESPEGDILLVKHTYMPGWHLPGGGVKIGETMEEALNRELLEETGLKLKHVPKLMGAYANIQASNRDHILLYVCATTDELIEKRCGLEISEAKFFSIKRLPNDIDPGSNKRLKEHLRNAPQEQTW